MLLGEKRESEHIGSNGGSTGWMGRDVNCDENCTLSLHTRTLYNGRLEAVVDSWIDALFKELPRHVAYDSGKLKEYEAKVAAGEIDSSMSAVAGLVSKKEQLVDDKADDGDEKKKKGKEEGEAKMMNLSSAVNDEKDFGIVSSSQTSSTTKTTSNPPPTASSCSPKLEDKVASMSITLSSLTTTATSEPFQQYTPRPLSLPTDVFESITQIKGQVKRAVEFVSISYPNDNDNITRSVESSRLASIYPLLRSQSSQTTSPPALLGPLNPALAIITRCRCLTGSKAEKRVIEIELDTTTTNSLLEEWMENTAAPGDAFALVCPNPDSMVLPLLDRLGFDPERVFEVEVQDGGDGKRRRGVSFILLLYSTLSPHAYSPNQPKDTQTIDTLRSLQIFPRHLLFPTQTLFSHAIGTRN